MSNSVLISLAFLMVNWDNGNGFFLDNFLPFLAQAIKQQENDVISIPELQKLLNDLFKLCIPQNVIKALLFRAKKKDVVILKDHVFYRNQKYSGNDKFSETQIQVQRIFSALVSNFTTFVKNKYSIELNDSEAENILLAFISYNQLYFFQTDEEDKVIQNIPNITREQKIIVSAYIIEVSEKNPLVFSYLDTIVKGLMIANVLYLPDVHMTNRKFRKTKIYLDTSFILYALGYSGFEEQAPCLELLDLLRINNAQIYCFDHTIEEIKGILDAAANHIGGNETGTFGRSIRYFTQSGYSSSQIKLFRSQLERNMERLGIRKASLPDYSNRKYIIGEDELFSHLKKEMPSNRDAAISRDVASISAIYRLRRNETVSSIEDTNAIFVSTTDTLCRAANNFYYQTHDRLLTPPCISDFMLTNILWLKTPNQAPNLPMKRIIADSFAAIEPDSALMKKWLTVINTLKQNQTITEEDYYFLRLSREAESALTNYSLGDPNIVTTGSVPVILEKAKDKIREEMKNEIEGETQKRIQTEVEYSQHLAFDRRTSAERENYLTENSKAIIKPIMVVIKILLFVIFGALFVFSLPYDVLLSSNLSSIISKWPKFILAIIFLALWGFMVVQWYWGNSFKAYLARFEIYLQHQVYKFLDSLSSKNLVKTKSALATKKELENSGKPD